MEVCTNAIVVRYDVLSCIEDHNLRHTFSIDPELPAVLIERQENETWLQACNRTHQQVLRLVQMQVDNLRKAQRAAAALLNPDETVSTNCAPEFDALKTQLAVARHDDEIGVQVHQETLQRLG